MERLYLIRVGMERFLGPYTLKQVQEAYHKMQFGLQDEISGSLRQWVTFDNVEQIRRHYPELVQLINTDMLSGWGMVVQNNAGPNLPTPASAARSRVTPFENSRRSSLMPMLAGSLVLFFVILALFSYRDGEWVNPVAYLRDRSYFQARALYGDDYNPRFEAYMDRNKGEITSAMKKRRGFNLWLPYVRSVAYSRDGRWDGLSPKRLKGAGDASLPVDCSVAAWDERWRASRSDWISFLEGRRLPSEDWSRILMMDTHWIKNRSPMPGWEEPGSYHEACLRMAVKSLERLASEENSWDAKVLISRLRWQLGSISGKAPSEEYEMSGTLWAMSCVEDAREAGELRNCFNPVKVRGAWQGFFDAMVTVRRMALIAAREGHLTPEALAELKELLAEFKQTSKAHFLDYEAELRFYEEILSQNGNTKAARSVLAKKYPSLHFEN